MSTTLADRLKYPAIALVVGILSALLTAESLRLVHPLNPWLGSIFGAAITLLVWIKYKSCSFAFAITLIASSVVAYCAAVWGAPLIVTFVRNTLRVENRGNPFDAQVFSFAGFLGALIMAMALLLLLPKQTGLRMIAKATAFACAGAFLGWLSSELTASVSAIIQRLAANDTVALELSDYYRAFCSAYLIWQTGMAFLVPLMWPHDSVAGSEHFISISRSPAKLSVFGKVLFFCIFTSFATITYFEARDLYRRWDFQRETDKLQETPSTDNLPAIQLKPLEQMLILHDIAGYAAGIATANVRPAYTAHVGPKGVVRNLAERIVYRVDYERPGSTPSAASRAKPRAVVLEFPNAEWARYQVKNGPEYDGQFLYITSVRTNKFGHPVLDYPASGGPDQWIFWPSENKVVVVYYPGQQAEEIVKQYLAKYPSSL